MKKKNVIALALLGFALMACQQTKKDVVAETSHKSAFDVQDCDLTLGGIHFTKMINGADKQVSGERRRTRQRKKASGHTARKPMP